MDLVLSIVSEIADKEETSLANLPPLYETLDTEALQAFVESAEDITVSIEFVYNDYTVRIGSDGDIEVRE